MPMLYGSDGQPMHNPDLPPIVDVLPHRGTDLMLDTVAEAEPGQWALGSWTADPANYAGHFPNMHLVPGHMQIESLTLLGGYALMMGQPNQMATLRGYENVQFEQAVRPGETLDMFVIITDADKRTFKGEGVAWVMRDDESQVACQGIILGTLMPRRVATRVFADPQNDSVG